ncbi:MAG: hypothetical protein ACP5IL_17555, partial [Syntrophobacteraceae bacterium]
MFNGGSTNLYGYVQDDPVNWIDPFGLITFYVGSGGSDFGGDNNGGNATAQSGFFANFYDGSSSAGAYTTSGGGTQSFGAGAGLGPTVGFFTGAESAFSGSTNNQNYDFGSLGTVTYSSNDSGWGLSYSNGPTLSTGGYFTNQTNTQTFDFANGNYD